MYLFYLDGSAEHHYHTFSAIGIPEETWRFVFDALKSFRENLRTNHGVYVSKELHAWKFLSGRGRPSDQFLSKRLRASIFNDALALLASFAPQGVVLFNAALNNEDWAFERLLNRINRTMQERNSRVLLICDEGKEEHYTRLRRRMGAHNPIPSKFGTWQDGKSSKNIPIDRILEDPVFKQSHRSNFIQVADLCAFALLRMDRPTPPMTALGIDKSFPILAPICVKEANPKDPYGVTR